MPGIFILMLKTEVRAVNSIVRLSGPPQAQLAGISGSTMVPRCLPEGLQALVDITTWDRPEIFNWIQEVGDIPETDLWNTFNLGVGFCFVVPSYAVNSVLEICLNNGFESWIMGRIEEASNSRSKEILGLPI